MSSKKRITLSIVSIAALLALLVGVTMAWFTDVERVDANFEAVSYTHLTLPTIA